MLIQLNALCYKSTEESDWLKKAARNDIITRLEVPICMECHG